MDYRELINRILNKLEDEQIRLIYIFIKGYTGYTGWEGVFECRDEGDV